MNKHSIFEEEINNCKTFCYVSALDTCKYDCFSATRSEIKIKKLAW